MPARTQPVPVVHVVQNLAIGGLERVVLNLALHAHRDRFSPSIVCLGAGGPLVEQARSAGIGVRVIGQGAGFRPQTVLSLARHFRKDGVKVVHGHNAAPLVYGALAGRLARCGVVYTAHGMTTSKARNPARLSHMGWVDDFITVSEDARQIAIEKAGMAPARVRTIVNGVDTRTFMRPDDATRLRTRAQLGLANDAFVFGIVARLSAAKDHANLFRAFADVARTHAEARLVVVGDGELRADLERLVTDLGIQDRIVMTLSRNDIKELLGAFDTFVLSSYTEGLAMTLLEAASSELPIVATAVGGNTEVVVDHETGLVVPARDSVRLAEAMNWIAAHPSESRAMGARGRNRVAQKFSIDAMVDAYEAAYARAMERR